MEPAVSSPTPASLLPAPRASLPREAGCHVLQFAWTEASELSSISLRPHFSLSANPVSPTSKMLRFHTHTHTHTYSHSLTISTAAPFIQGSLDCLLASDDCPLRSVSYSSQSPPENTSRILSLLCSAQPSSAHCNIPEKTQESSWDWWSSPFLLTRASACPLPPTRNAVPQLDTVDSSFPAQLCSRVSSSHLCEILPDILSPTLVCFFTLLPSVYITLRF